MTTNGKPKFNLGQILATPGALEALQESGQNVQFFLARHVRGDWGEVCASDGRGSVSCGQGRLRRQPH